MNLSIDQVKHIANLSKLSLSGEELNKYTSDLSNIVSYAESLSEVDVTNVEPTAHILKIQNVFRKDDLKKSYEREILLKNAPTQESGCISVPKVVE